MKFLIPFASCLLAATATAQQTFVVADTSGLLGAVAVAGAQDLILLEPGEYAFSLAEPLTLSGPMRIAARVAGTVEIRGPLPVNVLGIGENEVLSLDGIQFVHASNGAELAQGPGINIQMCCGSIALHDCDFTGANLGTSSPGLFATGGTVLASDCRFTGGGEVIFAPNSPIGPAVRAVHTRLMLDDCSLTARDGRDASAPSLDALAGGRALLVEGGSLEAARTSFLAGNGGAGAEDSVPGTCLFAGAGGSAILALGPDPTPIELFDSVLQPGAGGVEHAACGGGHADAGLEFDGAGHVSGLTTVHPFAIGLNAPGAVAGGWSVAVQVIAFDYASPKWLAVGRSATANMPLGLDGFPVLIDSPFNWIALPPSGAQVFSLPVLAGMNSHAALVLQGLELSPSLTPLITPTRLVSVY